MAGFGSLGGLGGMSYPTRNSAPTSQNVANDGELDYLLDNWVSGRRDEQARLSATDINQQAAQRAYAAFTNAYGGDIPFGIGLPTGSAPRTELGSQVGVQPIQNLDAWTSAANNGDTYSGGQQNFNLSNWIEPQRQRLQQGIAASNAAIEADIAARQAEHQTLMQDRAQNQATQQQAYNGLAGNGLLNGMINNAYAMPGFGQVTGQTSQNFGQEMGSAAAASTAGVFDPSTQSGVYGAATPKRQWGLF